MYLKSFIFLLFCAGYSTCSAKQEAEPGNLINIESTNSRNSIQCSQSSNGKLKYWEVSKNDRKRNIINQSNINFADYHYDAQAVEIKLSNFFVRMMKYIAYYLLFCSILPLKRSIERDAIKVLLKEYATLSESDKNKLEQKAKEHIKKYGKSVESHEIEEFILVRSKSKLSAVLLNPLEFIDYCQLEGMELEVLQKNSARYLGFSIMDSDISNVTENQTKKKGPESEPVKLSDSQDGSSSWNDYIRGGSEELKNCVKDNLGEVAGMAVGSIQSVQATAQGSFNKLTSEATDLIAMGESVVKTAGRDAHNLVFMAEHSLNAIQNSVKTEILRFGTVTSTTVDLIKKVDTEVQHLCVVLERTLYVAQFVAVSVGASIAVGSVFIAGQHIFNGNALELINTGAVILCVVTCVTTITKCVSTIYRTWNSAWNSAWHGEQLDMPCLKGAAERNDEAAQKNGHLTLTSRIFGWLSNSNSSNSSNISNIDSENAPCVLVGVENTDNATTVSDATTINTTTINSTTVNNIISVLRASSTAVFSVGLAFAVYRSFSVAAISSSSSSWQLVGIAAVTTFAAAAAEYVIHEKKSIITSKDAALINDTDQIGLLAIIDSKNMKDHHLRNSAEPFSNPMQSRAKVAECQWSCLTFLRRTFYSRTSYLYSICDAKNAVNRFYEATTNFAESCNIVPTNTHNGLAINIENGISSNAISDGRQDNLEGNGIKQTSLLITNNAEGVDNCLKSDGNTAIDGLVSGGAWKVVAASAIFATSATSATLIAAYYYSGTTQNIYHNIYVWPGIFATAVVGSACVNTYINAHVNTTFDGTFDRISNVMSNGAPDGISNGPQLVITDSKEAAAINDTTQIHLEENTDDNLANSAVEREQIKDCKNMTDSLITNDLEGEDHHHHQSEGNNAIYAYGLTIECKNTTSSSIIDSSIIDSSIIDSSIIDSSIIDSSIIDSSIIDNSIIDNSITNNSTTNSFFACVYRFFEALVTNNKNPAKGSTKNGNSKQSSNYENRTFLSLCAASAS